MARADQFAKAFASLLSRRPFATPLLQLPKNPLMIKKCEKKSKKEKKGKDRKDREKMPDDTRASLRSVSASLARLSLSPGEVRADAVAALAERLRRVAADERKPELATLSPPPSPNGDGGPPSVQGGARPSGATSSLADVLRAARGERVFRRSESSRARRGVGALCVGGRCLRRLVPAPLAPLTLFVRCPVASWLDVSTLVALSSTSVLTSRLALSAGMEPVFASLLSSHLVLLPPLSPAAWASLERKTGCKPKRGGKREGGGQKKKKKKEEEEEEEEEEKEKEKKRTTTKKKKKKKKKKKRKRKRKEKESNETGKEKKGVFPRGCANLPKLVPKLVPKLPARSLLELVWSVDVSLSRQTSVALAACGGGGGGSETLALEGLRLVS